MIRIAVDALVVKTSKNICWLSGKTMYLYIFTVHRSMHFMFLSVPHVLLDWNWDYLESYGASIFTVSSITSTLARSKDLLYKVHEHETLGVFFHELGTASLEFLYSLSLFGLLGLGRATGRTIRVVKLEDTMKLLSALAGVMARRLGRLGRIDRTGDQNVSKRFKKVWRSSLKSWIMLDQMTNSNQIMQSDLLILQMEVN